MARTNFQKHKLINILPIVDVGKTEYENMKDNGYNRIWDCGSSAWTYCPTIPQK